MLGWLRISLISVPCGRGARVNLRRTCHSIGRSTEGCVWSVTPSGISDRRHDHISPVFINHQWLIRLGDMISMCQSRSWRGLPRSSDSRIPATATWAWVPVCKSLGSDDLCLLVQILQLWVRLRSHDLPCLPSLPFPDRIIPLQDWCQRIPSSNHILTHVLQSSKSGRNVVHLTGVPCSRPCIRIWIV